MPYNIKKEGDGYFVMKHGKRMNKKPHRTRKEAIEHLQALYVHAPKSERAP